ncbi:plasmid mobilization protein [Anabaena lutea]
MKRDREVRFRASTQEVEVIRQKADDAGYCLSEYLRLLALGYLASQST